MTLFAPFLYGSFFLVVCPFHDDFPLPFPLVCVSFWFLSPRLYVFSVLLVFLL